MNRRALRADGVLLLVAAIWGFAFVAQRAGMEHLGPFAFNAMRFALGAAVLVPVWLARRGASSGGRRQVLVGSALAGTAVFVAASLQQVGLVHTTAGKAGFITGLYVVIVPLLASAWGQRVGAPAWLGAALAVVGLFLLCVEPHSGIERGDLLVLGGSCFWAAHVLILDRFARRVDPIELAALQFVVCSAASLVVAAAAERFEPAALRSAALPLAYAGVLSVGVGYTLQVIGQRDAQPTTAAILLGLEAAFAAIGGFLLLGERLSPRGLAGCALLLGAVVVAQLGRSADPAVPELRS